jgi:hypothetical protein
MEEERKKNEKNPPWAAAVGGPSVDAQKSWGNSSSSFKWDEINPAGLLIAFRQWIQYL